jgi:predicted permease
VRYAFRAFGQRPGFAFASVITLSLGIGANTAIFSIVNGVLLRPLPFDESDRLVILEQDGPYGRAGYSVPELEALRVHAATLEAVVEYHSLWFNLIADGDPERVLSGVVSWQFFEMLGIEPLVGRAFQPGDDAHGAPAVLVLSYEYWQRSFHGDPDVVGRVLHMNDREYSVVGVLPPLPQYPRANDVYMPTVACPYRSSASWIENPNARAIDLLARVRAGVPEDSLVADVRSVMQSMRERMPTDYRNVPAAAPLVSPLRERLVEDARPAFLALLATVGVVLLVALANVASLSLANLVRREREMTIRTTLGATRGRLTRQLMTESTVLALIGGALGLALAAAGMDLLVRFAARFTQRAEEITIDGWVLAFTVVLSVGTGVIFGGLPGFPLRRSASLEISGARITTGQRTGRLRKLLVTSQLALSFVVLIVAGLMMRTTMALQQVEPGFREENVVTMTIAVPFTRPAPETPVLFEQMLRRVHALPDIVSVSIATAFPLGQHRPGYGPFERADAPTDDGDTPPVADFRLVAPDYFEVIRQPVVDGRGFTWEDVRSAERLILVNEHLARRYFGNESAVGRRLNTSFGDDFTIIGVVGDVRQHGLAAAVTNELYLGLGTMGGRTVTLLARGPLEGPRVAEHVREVLRDLDPEVAVADVQTLQQIRRDALASPMLVTTLLSLFGTLALAITATGIAGIIGFAVSQRTHEIGVRRALGAHRAALLATILRQGLAPVATGLVLGVAGAMALSRALRDLLFGVEATDPLTFLGVAIVLSGVALVAAFIPARRAVMIDPVTALRSE